MILTRLEVIVTRIKWKYNSTLGFFKDMGDIFACLIIYY